MLVLTRTVNERVIVNDEVTITVVEIRGDRVKLGFDAPLHIDIHRQEYWMKLKEAKQALPHMDG